MKGFETWTIEYLYQEGTAYQTQTGYDGDDASGQMQPVITVPAYTKAQGSIVEGRTETK